MKNIPSKRKVTFLLLVKTDLFKDSLGSFLKWYRDSMSRSKQFVSDRYIGSVFLTDFEHSFFSELQMRIVQYEF